MGGRGKAQRLPVSLRSAPGCDGCIDYAVWPLETVVASIGKSGITPVFSGIKTPVSGRVLLSGQPGGHS